MVKLSVLTFAFVIPSVYGAHLLGVLDKSDLSLSDIADMTASLSDIVTKLLCSGPQGNRGAREAPELQACAVLAKAVVVPTVSVIGSPPGYQDPKECQAAYDCLNFLNGLPAPAV